MSNYLNNDPATREALLAETLAEARRRAGLDPLLDAPTAEGLTESPLLIAKEPSDRK
jgi:hypothetical protein